MILRVAVVAGPMYDGLTRLLEDDDGVEIVIRADHPTLNRLVADALGRGDRLDVISTHGKYAPSQRQRLLPVEEVPGLAPGAVGLCRDADGTLLCVPRNIDVRVLWRRADVVPDPPDTWDDVLGLARAGRRFGFPQRDSGLFGTFFELIVGRGGSLASLSDEDAVAAAVLLRELAAGSPPEWHYDEVDRALGHGQVAMAAAWPGATGSLRSSPAGPTLRPSAYPAGPVRRVSYAGCHAWGIPRTCADVPAATALIERLSSADAARLEAASGAIPAHLEVAAAIEPRDAVDAERLRLIREAIADQMITYPPDPAFAEYEERGWRLVADVIAGRREPGDLRSSLAGDG